MNKKIQFLKQVPFFENLEFNELEKVASLFITRKYDRGLNVFLEGGEGEEFYLIQSGVVKIYKESDTREIILAVFGEGEFFGEMAVLENQKTRSASAMVMEQSNLYVLKRKDFISVMNQNPQIAIKIMHTALERLRAANELIKDLTFRDAKTRIANGLYRLMEKRGMKLGSGALIDIKLTHQQIADISGTVRETVTKVMLDLQGQGIIQIDKKKIFIHDLEKFKQLLGEEW